MPKSAIKSAIGSCAAFNCLQLSLPCMLLCQGHALLGWAESMRRVRAAVLGPLLSLGCRWEAADHPAAVGGLFVAAQGANSTTSLDLTHMAHQNPGHAGIPSSASWSARCANKLDAAVRQRSRRNPWYPFTPK